MSPLDLRYRVPASLAEIDSGPDAASAPEVLDDERGRWSAARLPPGESIQISIAATQCLAHVIRNHSPRAVREEVVQAADPATEA